MPKPRPSLMALRRQKTEEDIVGLEGLGRAVRELRERKGWNRHEVAKRAALDLTTIYAVERSANELTWGNLRRLAEGVDTAIDDLIRLAEALAPGEGGERWRLWSWAAERERDRG